MYQFKWILCKKKCSVGFSVMLQSHRWERRFLKVLTALSCIMQWYNKPTGDDCLQEVWAEGTMKQLNCCILYLGQVLWSAVGKHSPFKQQITVCLLYCFSGLFAFCLAVLLLTYIVTTRMWSFRVLDSRHIIHILRFITSNFYPLSLMIIAALAIFQAWICFILDHLAFFRWKGTLILNMFCGLPSSGIVHSMKW
jgi:hypothetical protein